MISDKIKSQGELHKGYIVGMKIISEQVGFLSLHLNVFFDGKIHLVIDDSFIDYYEMFIRRYSVNNSDIFVKGIPVDVYVRKGNIYLDLNSIKMEEL